MSRISTEWWCFRHPKKCAALLRERADLIRVITMALVARQAESLSPEPDTLSTLLQMREKVRNEGFHAGITAARRKDGKNLD